jgi:hypothetical protein
MDGQPYHGLLEVLAEPRAVPRPWNGRRDDSVFLTAYARQLSLDIYFGGSKVIAPPSARLVPFIVVLGLAPTYPAPALISLGRACQNHECIGFGHREKIYNYDFSGAD